MNAATKTYTPRAKDITRNWRVFDATGRPLGRLASEIAQVLRGKDKPTFTPNLDTGDFVVVVNASQVVVTGAKSREKMYYTHSNYPGGLRETAFHKMLAQHPRRVVEWAVWGMLPKGPLGRRLFTKLKVYAEATHPHGAQNVEMAAPVRMGKPGRPRPAAKRSLAAAAPTAVAVPATVEAPPPPGAGTTRPRRGVPRRSLEGSVSDKPPRRQRPGSRASRQEGGRRKTGGNGSVDDHFNSQTAVLPWDWKA